MTERKKKEKRKTDGQKREDEKSWVDRKKEMWTTKLTIQSMSLFTSFANRMSFI